MQVSIMRRRLHDGFILPLTLMMLSVMMVIITHFAQRTQVHINFDKVIIEREKAKQLALGGIQLAISQVSLLETQTVQTQIPEQKTGEKTQQKDPNKELLIKLLPVLNRWQTFALKEKIDGIEGQVQICISSEEGKFNINQWFDFEKKKFVGEGIPGSDSKQALQMAISNLSKFIGGKNIMPEFEKFLKQRQYKLDDVTELLLVKDIREAFRNKDFYQPPDPKQKRKRAVYLSDIFTVWSMTRRMNPWLLSDSIAAIFDLPRADSAPTMQSNQLKEFFAKTPISAANLETLWNASLQKWYNKEFKAMPKEMSMLVNSQFEATTFSVLSFGTVGTVTQRLFAIIQRQDSKKCIVKKLYWL